MSTARVGGGRPVLLGLCYDSSSSYLRGPADAPPKIREALRSDSSNWWTESLRDLSVVGTYGDDGDLALGDDALAAHAVIERAVLDIMARGERPVLLGGDHSVTYPILRAVRQHHERLTILHLDAHNDLYDVFEGDRYSHACPFARIMENRLADQLVQVGTRTTSGHQREQAQRFGVQIVDMKRFMRGERWTLRHPVYVSLDIDVLDPAFAPGISHREPGGMSVRDVIEIIQSIDVPVVGADLVEYNPRRDIDDMTAPVAAKLLKEILSLMLDGSDPR